MRKQAVKHRAPSCGRARLGALVLLAELLMGCATIATAPSSSPGARQGAEAHSADSNEARLSALRQAREHAGKKSDFTLGPGDVLEISVPDMAELRDAQVRISGDNTIALPLLGTIPVAGLTQDQVRERLREHLRTYLHDPQVGVFVREFRSREVAVVGMVQKPGLYTMTSFNDSVLQMVSLAGGPTAQAASYVILIPAGAGQPGLAPFLAAAATQSAEPRVTAVRATREEASQRIEPGETGPGAPPSVATLNKLDPSIQPRALRIDSGSAAARLDLPARPGDVIIVPVAGEVMVQGWVANPGAFHVVPGMTVLSAVAAAGGPMFSSSAQVLRPLDNGSKREFDLDLSHIQSGETPDLELQSGDLVIVNRSLTGAVPYLVYEVFSKLGAGVYATPF
jgi:protein involved in polysaccharide export with SLBB domain